MDQTWDIDSWPAPRALNDVPAPAAVLVVDDERAVTAFLTRVLTGHGYAVRSLDDGPGALAAVKEQPPDLLSLEVGLPRMSGVEVCRHAEMTWATSSHR